MIGPIIELALGWFIAYKCPRLFKAKGMQANIIKLIGGAYDCRCNKFLSCRFAMLEYEQ